MQKLPVFLRSLSIVTFVAIAVGFSAIPATASETHVDESKYGFSFSLPTDWEKVPLNGGDINGLLTKATKEDPGLKNSLSNQIKKAAAEGIKFFAIGPVDGRTSPDLNIIVTSSSTGLTGKAYYEAADAQVKIELAQAGLKDVKTSIVQFSFGKALQASYAIPKTDFGAAEFGIQLYVKHNAQLDILTITSGSVKKSESTTKAVAESWHWS